MKKNQTWTLVMGIALVLSMVLAWNERIPDPLGLYMVLLSMLGLMIAIVFSSWQFSVTGRKRNKDS